MSLQKMLNFKSATCPIGQASNVRDRALHHNCKHMALWVFYTGTCTIPFGLVVQYLTAVTNTDIYPSNLLP